MDKRVISLFVSVLVIGIVVSPAAAQQAAKVEAKPLKLPRVIGSGMVLQRDIELPVWGWAAPQQKVTVSIAGNEKTATAGADGKWMVKMPAMKAGGPHKMKVTAAQSDSAQAAAIELDDILVGEVWVCSG